MAVDVAEPMSAEQVDTVGAPVRKQGRRKAEDDPREVFSVPAEMLNENGKIKVWQDECGYKFGAENDCHQPIKKELFESDEVLIDYRIGGKRYKISLIQEEIDDLVTQRDKTSTITNPVNREKAKRAIKAKAMLAKLMRELAAQGVDVDEMLGN